MISRQSVVGHFPVKKLGEVVEFLDNLRRPVTESDREDGPYPYYGANGQQGTIADFIFDEPLVLLAEDGGHFENPARGIAYRISGKTWVNNHAHVLRPKADIDIAYLCRVLENYDVTPFVTGTTRGKLTKGGASEIPIPLPPLPEQRRIAAILDKADALRTKRREALAQLDRLAQSIFVEMFGEPVTNSKGWPTHPLRELASRIQIGPFGSQLHEEDYVEGGIPLVNPTHIQQGQIKPDWTLTVPHSKHAQLEQYHLSKGDLILGRRGEMGRCAVVSPGEDGWLCGTGSLFVRPNASVLSSRYLQAVISSPSMRRHLENVSQGVTMANLNKDIVGALPIALPPKEVQDIYFSRIGSVSGLIERHGLSEKAQQDLFASLQHRAFRGEL